MSESTAVAPKRELPPEIQARVEENKQKNAIVAAIRGTIWGKDLSEQQVRAVAQYARENGIDPVRHVEVLGGRIYLTAELYDERGADLIQSGVIQPLPVRFLQDDPRLAPNDGDSPEMAAWKRTERESRMRARIEVGAPESAKAIAVAAFRVTATGAVIEGVNWCGGGSRQRDPVGDAEPTKTAHTRARRRAWKQLVAAVPQMAARVERLEATAEVVEGRLLEVAAPRETGRRLGSGTVPSDYDDTRPQAGREVPVTVGTSTPVATLPQIPEAQRDPYGFGGDDQ